MHWRGLVFTFVVTACLVASGVYVGMAMSRAHGSAPPPGIRVVTGASLVQDSNPHTTTARSTQAIRTTRAVTLQTAKGPQLLFRNAIPDQTFGELAVAPLANPNATRAVSNLKCDRVYFAQGRGLCLTATGSWPTTGYIARIFDANFKVLRQVRLTGIPSRARISADGRLGATTVFVNGDSYAPGNFSTRTDIIDMGTGKILANLESFIVTRDGERFHNKNFNFWGLTFARDDDRFYATLGSGAQTYLVQGSLRRRTMRVIHDHVECPSLSPDGTRIAFKRSLNSHGSWRLYVLDLKTMRETPLAEPDSVDDQVEWLDNNHVLYWLHTDIWTVAADGTGTPRRFVTDASSPVVVKPA
jgi:dipeptidyl aminopeptidase/acylaminoacyl peptidase